MPYSQVTRGPITHDILIWISARNRTTNQIETVGLWSGLEDRSFNIGSDVRSYAGAGAILDVPPIVTKIGLTVQLQRATLAGNSPQIEAAVQAYDARQAPTEIHVARFDPETGALIGIDRVFKGFIDQVARNRGTRDQPGNATWTVTLASATRALTRELTLKRSDASQRLRGLDGFFRYADVSGAVERFWGTERT